jgi:hypothetical protein
MDKYMCQNCDKCFNQKCHLNYHIKNNACKTYNHFCKICGKGFTTLNSMYRHMKNNCAIKKENEKEKAEIFDRLLKLEEENKRLKTLEQDNKKLIKEVANIKKQIKTKNVVTNNGTLISDS